MTGKLVMALCAASVAGICLAADGVESANIVGYNTTEIKGDTWYMVGIQYQGIGSDAESITLDDLISMTGVTACGYDDQVEKGAQIQYFNGVGYDFFYYISDAYNSNEDEVGYDCWAKGGYETTEIKTPVGEGFWFKAPAVAIQSGATMTVKGQVIDAVSKTVDFTANEWKIISNPFPCAIGLHDVVTTGITACGYDDQVEKGAQIQYFNGVGYDFFYYISDAYNSNEDEVGYDCWAKGGYETTEAHINVGEAFWIKSPQSGTLTFSL